MVPARTGSDHHSRNHAGFEHFVDKGTCHFIKECPSPLRIGTQQLNDFLLLWRLLLAFLDPQLLTCRLMIVSD